MRHQCRNRDDHAGGSAHQRLANAAGELIHIAYAVIEDAHEHLDHADHGTEQTQQWPSRCDRAQRVQIALHAMHHMPAGVLDTFADHVTRAATNVKRRGQQGAQRRIAAQRLDVGGIQIAARGPIAHFFTQARRRHLIAAQAPHTLQHDRQGDHAQQQQRHHRPTACLDQLQHDSIPPATRPPVR